MVRLCAEGASVLLRIEDSGVGFDDKLAERLFEPFVQEEQQIDRLDGGLGLGLAISRKLTELQGGSLSGESRGAGCGAVFTLTLPLVAGVSTAPSVESARRKDRNRVLIIEDNEDAADTMAELIGLLGCEVDTAYDGRSALASAMVKPPDLIICDLGLPGALDGYAVARAVRAELALRNKRLFALSGYSQAEDHANAKRAGFERLVSKPITGEILEAILNEPSPQRFSAD